MAQDINKDVTQDSISYVKLPINVVKRANVLINERNKFKDVLDEQNLMIVDYKKYIEEQESIIADYKDKVRMCNDINERLNKSIIIEKNKSKLWKTVAIISTSLVIGSTVAIIH